MHCPFTVEIVLLLWIATHPIDDTDQGHIIFNMVNLSTGSDIAEYCMINLNSSMLSTWIRTHEFCHALAMNPALGELS